MKKEKTSKVLAVYNVLSSAKYTKMEDSDKITAWKICRFLKPIATKFDEDSKDAAEKLRPSEDFAEKLMMAQEYEKMIRQPNFDAQKLPMGVNEYNDFIKELQKYNKVVGEAIKEYGDKEVELDFKLLSEDAFGKLMASNEWTMEQATSVGEIICGM